MPDENRARTRIRRNELLVLVEVTSLTDNDTDTVIGSELYMILFTCLLSVSTNFR
jgi:hypothetical protein